MNWKLFITAFISCIYLLFPCNIIGCGGGDIDPYDYYVSFFQKKLAGDAAYEPFYYTNNQFLYDVTEPVNVAELTAAKCDQKQAGNIPWDKAGVQQWVKDFNKRNSYYSKLQKEFGTTPFYKEAFTTCSYLQDFVKQSD